LTLLISPTKEVEMKTLMLVLVLMVALGQWGCAFLGGAAVGALGTSAGYEINAHSQMSKLEDDYKSERISRREYETRKAQIEKGSIIY
jgi:hypothetical protein